MDPKERDRLIEAAEELKAQRTRETCVRAVVYVQGKEYAPNRRMRDRYFIVNIPKSVLDDKWNDANRYVNSRVFPIFFEMVNGGRFEPPQVMHFLGDGREDIEEITA